MVLVHLHGDRLNFSRYFQVTYLPTVASRFGLLMVYNENRSLEKRFQFSIYNRCRMVYRDVQISLL